MYNYDYVGNLVEIQTRSGVRVATGFNRIILGERGAYVEFLTSQVLQETFTVPNSQSWRLRGLSGFRAFYDEYRTADDVKVYHQKRRVSYADYVIGRWYISPAYLKDFVRKDD